MSNRICVLAVGEHGWRAIFRRENGYEAVPVTKWGWTATPSGPHPLSIAGKRLDTEAGYIGLAEPPECLADAVARITEGTG